MPTSNRMRAIGVNHRWTPHQCERDVLLVHTETLFRNSLPNGLMTLSTRNVLTKTVYWSRVICYALRSSVLDIRRQLNKILTKFKWYQDEYPLYWDKSYLLKLSQTFVDLSVDLAYWLGYKLTPVFCKSFKTFRPRVFHDIMCVKMHTLLLFRFARIEW